jgi:hypothetical protein
VSFRALLIEAPQWHRFPRFRLLTDVELEALPEAGTQVDGRVIDPKAIEAIGVAAFRRRRSISARLRASVFERDNFRCRRCGAGPQDSRLVVDHIMPVALGGSTDENNLQTLCETCNLGKAARYPHAHDMAVRS